MTRRPDPDPGIGCAAAFAAFVILMGALFLFDTFGGFEWLSQ